MAENIQEPQGKTCCPDEKPGNPAKRAGVVAIVAGLVAALLGSLCCAGPLLAILLGVSGAAALAGLGKYHVYFFTAAVLVLLGGSFFIWRKAKTCTVQSNKGFWIPLLTSFAVFSLLTLGINQILIPFLSQSTSGQTQATSGKSSQLHLGVFNIDGMDCAGCAGTIQTALSKTPGVERAIVSFDKKQAEVTYEPSMTTTEQLIAVIGSTSYKARLLKDALLR